MKTFSSKVELDSITKGVAQPFEYTFDGTRTFVGWDKPVVPDGFRLGLLVGPSGSGKSLLLKEFGQELSPSWLVGKSVASHFQSVDDAMNRLTGVGLNSIPAWCSDYHVLSTGEKFRADLARKIDNGAVIDEFTSVVDRTVAKAASCALRRYVDKHNVTGMVLASCHEDIIPWLQPDWYFTTVDGILHDGRLLRRPPITLRIYPCERSVWALFKSHHYFSQELSSSCYSYLATAEFDGMQETVVGFVSALPMPSGTLKNAWREHRTVVLPDYQGLGIGPRISNGVAQLMVDSGRRYYSRTSHPRFGGYRNNPEFRDAGYEWIPSYGNMATRSLKRIRSKGKQDLDGMGDQRLCFSHEYRRVWEVEKRSPIKIRFNHS
jgi:GNAT superfamily N-acetyltransferase